MRTYLDCYPCFVRQMIQAGRLLNINETDLAKILKETLEKLIHINPESPPPQTAPVIYNSINKYAGNNDPYHSIKKQYNDIALKYYDIMKKNIYDSENKLLMGFKIAAAGNIIDFGASDNFDLDGELDNIKNIEFVINDLKKIEKLLPEINEVLYIGDNCGEIVFDKILIELLLEQYKNLNIIYAVRGQPIINDITIDDAKYVGLDKVCNIIDNGTGFPGTVLSECSEEFKKKFNRADLVISKGQGNFETLCDTTDKENIFFVLKIKCQMVSNHIGEDIGNIVLIKNKVNTIRV